MSKLYVILFVFVFLVSCEETTEWDIKEQEPGLLIVESIITNEYKQHTVKLSRAVKALNAEPEPVRGAKVYVSNGTNIFPFVEKDDTPGIYYSDTGAAGVNRVYRLRVSYENRVYRANDQMVLVTPFQTLDYKPVEGAPGLYQVDWNPGIYNSDEPCMWEILVDWSNVPGFTHLPGDSTKAKMLAYTLPSIDVAQIFKPDKKEVYFPAGSRIIHKKYSLSYKHSEFIRTLLAETEWRGGYFDDAPANVKTNLSEGAAGFFGLCAVLSDTVYVQAVSK